MDILYRDDAYLKSCEATVTDVSPAGIRLDRTVFYPTGGGQPGDTGVLKRADGGEVAIIDTRKGRDLDDIVHIPAEGAELPAVGDKVTAEIDWDRRYRLMRMHTCLHVLCALVEGDVTGGNIGEAKSRLDFNIPEGKPDKQELTRRLNETLEQDHAITTRWISDEEMAAQPELVRTMSVKPPMGYGKVRLLAVGDIDLQPCGGTHVRSTAEIGEMVVAKVESKGRQNRRITIRFAE